MQVPALTSCVNLEKPLYFSVPQFSHLVYGYGGSPLDRSVIGLNEILLFRCLRLCLVYGEVLNRCLLLMSDSVYVKYPE